MPLSREAALDLIVRVRLCGDTSGLIEWFAERVPVEMIYDLLKEVYPEAYEKYVVNGVPHYQDEKNKGVKNETTK